MIDLNSKECTYANLVILKIKRLLSNSEFNPIDFAPEEVINIALDILRIMLEIPFGEGNEDEHEWELFFDSEKSRKGVIILMNYLHRNAVGRNVLLNEIFETINIEDFEKLLKEKKEMIENGI